VEKALLAPPLGSPGCTARPMWPALLDACSQLEIATSADKVGGQGAPSTWNGQGGAELDRSMMGETTHSVRGGAYYPPSFCRMEFWVIVTIAEVPLLLYDALAT